LLRPLLNGARNDGRGISLLAMTLSFFATFQVIL
jgi:hypothetical protein